MVPVILGMVERGDRRHDIGAWFGLNQGRIKEVEDGEYGLPTPAEEEALPPSGSPGPRARGLRRSIDRVMRTLEDGDDTAAADALARLRRAAARFDQPE